MDEIITDLVLVVNTYLEKKDSVPHEILIKEGFSDSKIRFALDGEYIKDVSYHQYTLTGIGNALVRHEKEKIKAEFTTHKKKFYDHLKKNKRVLPKLMQFNLVYSKIVCPLCKKINLGTKYAYNICSGCDERITKNTTRWTKLKSVFSLKKRKINWTKWGTICTIIGILVTLMIHFSTRSTNTPIAPAQDNDIVDNKGAINPVTNVNIPLTQTPPKITWNIISSNEETDNYESAYFGSFESAYVTKGTIEIDSVVPLQSATLYILSAKVIGIEGGERNKITMISSGTVTYNNTTTSPYLTIDFPVGPLDIRIYTKEPYANEQLNLEYK